MTTKVTNAENSATPAATSPINPVAKRAVAVGRCAGSTGAASSTVVIAPPAMPRDAIR